MSAIIINPIVEEDHEEVGCCHYCQHSFDGTISCYVASKTIGDDSQDYAMCGDCWIETEDYWRENGYECDADDEIGVGQYYPRDQAYANEWHNYPSDEDNEEIDEDPSSEVVTEVVESDDESDEPEEAE